MLSEFVYEGSLGSLSRTVATFCMKASSSGEWERTQANSPAKSQRLQHIAHTFNALPLRGGAGRLKWTYCNRVANCSVSRSSGMPFRQEVNSNGPVNKKATSSSKAKSARLPSVLATPTNVGNPSKRRFHVPSSMRKPCSSLIGCPGLYLKFCQSSTS